MICQQVIDLSNKLQKCRAILQIYKLTKKRNYCFSSQRSEDSDVVMHVNKKTYIGIIFFLHDDVIMQ